MEQIAGTTTALDEPLVIVSADTHIGPRLVEDLRAYCPSRHLDAFDRFAAAHTAPLAADMFHAHPNFGTAGHFDASARLEDFDRDGVAAGVIFHGSQNLQPLPFIPNGRATVDPDMAAIGQEIYNRWLADVVAQAPERHVGLAYLPMWDIEASIGALRSARGAGLRGVNFPAPRDGFILEYNDRAWDPFWAACEELDLPLTTHVGGGSAARYEGPEAFALIAVETGGWFARRAMWWMIFGGVFERHPDLKLVITETPGNWWPTTSAELDSIYEMVAVTGRDRFPEFAAQVPRRPSEYMARNVHFGASFMAPFEAHHAVDAGIDTQLLWGSDYPHLEGTWKQPEDDAEPAVTRLALRNTFHEVPADATRRMIGENAVRVYGLDVDALHAVAGRIGAPTLRELSQPVVSIPSGASPQAFRSSGAWN